MLAHMCTYVHTQAVDHKSNCHNFCSCTMGKTPVSINVVTQEENNLEEKPSPQPWDHDPASSSIITQNTNELNINLKTHNLLHETPDEIPLERKLWLWDLKLQSNNMAHIWVLIIEKPNDTTDYMKEFQYIHVTYLNQHICNANCNLYWNVSGGINLGTHLHLVSRVRMSGAIPLLSYTTSWRGQGTHYMFQVHFISGVWYRTETHISAPWHL